MPTFPTYAEITGPDIVRLAFPLISIGGFDEIAISDDIDTFQELSTAGLGIDYFETLFSEIGFDFSSTSNDIALRLETSLKYYIAGKYREKELKLLDEECEDCEEKDHLKNDELLSFFFQQACIFWKLSGDEFKEKETEFSIFDTKDDLASIFSGEIIDCNYSPNIQGSTAEAETVTEKVYFGLPYIEDGILTPVLFFDYTTITGAELIRLISPRTSIGGFDELSIDEEISYFGSLSVAALAVQYFQGIFNAESVDFSQLDSQAANKLILSLKFYIAGKYRERDLKLDCEAKDGERDYLKNDRLLCYLYERACVFWESSTELLSSAKPVFCLFAETDDLPNEFIGSVIYCDPKKKVSNELVQFNRVYSEKQGPPGLGVPPGGEIGNVIVKTGSGDYQTGWSSNASISSESFESVARNIKSWNYSLTFTGEVLTSIIYQNGDYTVTKTLNYTGGKLTSVVLSGDTPLGISLTKTITYSGDNISNVSYT